MSYNLETSDTPDMKTVETAALVELISELDATNQVVVSLADLNPTITPRPELNSPESPALEVVVMETAEINPQEFAGRMRGVLDIIAQIAEYYRQNDDEVVSRISVVATYDEVQETGAIGIQVQPAGPDVVGNATEETHIEVSAIAIAESIRVELGDSFGEETRRGRVTGTIVGNESYEVFEIVYDNTTMGEIDFMGVKFKPGEDVLALRTETGNTYYVTSVTYAYLMQQSQLRSI